MKSVSGLLKSSSNQSCLYCIITDDDHKLYPSCTFQRVSCESQLADDVTRDVRFDALALFSVSFSGLQKVVKFLRVKLLLTQQHTLVYAAGLTNVEEDNARFNGGKQQIYVF